MPSVVAPAIINAPAFAFQIAALIWIFMIGCCVGSFLNVVIHRVPLRLSLNRPRSRCPICETPIKHRYNIPVVGWWGLGGRCYDCRTPIPARYPLVELTIGLIVLLLWVLTCGSGAATLPVLKTLPPDWTLFEQQLVGFLVSADHVLLFAAESVLLCLLLASALIDHDGNRWPLRFRVLAALLLFGFPVASTFVHTTGTPTAFTTSSIPPLEWNYPFGIIPEGSRWRGLFGSLGSGALGMIVGALFHAIEPLGLRLKHDDAIDRAGELNAVGAWIGIVLGWQAVISIYLVAGFLVVIVGRVFALWNPKLLRVPLTGWVTIATLIHLCAWEWIGADTPPRLLMHVLLLIGIGYIGRWLSEGLTPAIERQTPSRTGTGFFRRVRQPNRPPVLPTPRPTPPPSASRSDPPS